MSKWVKKQTDDAFSSVCMYPPTGCFIPCFIPIRANPDKSMFPACKRLGLMHCRPALFASAITQLWSDQIELDGGGGLVVWPRISIQTRIHVSLHPSILPACFSPLHLGETFSPLRNMIFSGIDIYVISTSS